MSGALTVDGKPGKVDGAHQITVDDFAYAEAAIPAAGTRYAAYGEYINTYGFPPYGSYVAVNLKLVGDGQFARSAAVSSSTPEGGFTALPAAEHGTSAVVSLEVLYRRPVRTGRRVAHRAVRRRAPRTRAGRRVPPRTAAHLRSPPPGRGDLASRRARRGRARRDAHRRVVASRPCRDPGPDRGAPRRTQVADARLDRGRRREGRRRLIVLVAARVPWKWLRGGLPGGVARARRGRPRGGASPRRGAPPRQGVSLRRRPPPRARAPGAWPQRWRHGRGRGAPRSRAPRPPGGDAALAVFAPMSVVSMRSAARSTPGRSPRRCTARCSSRRSRRFGLLFGTWYAGTPERRQRSAARPWDPSGRWPADGPPRRPRGDTARTHQWLPPTLAAFGTIVYGHRERCSLIPNSNQPTDAASSPWPARCGYSSP